MKSIIIYFIFYAIIIALTWLSDKTRKNNKKISKLLTLLAILVLSLFAGCRDYTVGKDISVYGLSSFNNSYNSSSLIKYLSIYNGEYLYYILNYVISHLTNDFHLFLFILQLISSILIYRIVDENRDKCNPTLLIFAYLMLWYNTSLNILRQSTAILIILYAYKYLENKKYFNYIIAIIIASMFHSSSMVCLSFLALKQVSKSKKYVLNSFFLGIATIIAFTQISNFLSLFSLFSDKYLVYVNSNDINIRYKYLFVKIIIFVFICIFYRKENKKEEDRLLIFAALYDVLFYLSSAFVKYGYRTSYFFLPHLIIFIPKIYSNLSKAKDRLIYLIFIVGLLIFHWIVRYCIIGYDSIIPFKFYWQ